MAMAVSILSGWFWTNELDVPCSSSFSPSGVHSGLGLKLNI